MVGRSRNTVLTQGNSPRLKFTFNTSTSVVLKQDINCFSPFAKCPRTALRLPLLFSNIDLFHLREAKNIAISGGEGRCG